MAINITSNTDNNSLNITGIPCQRALIDVEVPMVLASDLCHVMRAGVGPKDIHFSYDNDAETELMIQFHDGMCNYWFHMNDDARGELAAALTNYLTGNKQISRCTSAAVNTTILLDLARINGMLALAISAGYDADALHKSLCAIQQRVSAVIDRYRTM